MVSTVNLYSNKKGEINKFLTKLYDIDLDLENILKWNKEYNNPIEIAEIIGVFVDNIEDYSLNMWICLDKDVFISITTENADKIIKYLYERFPY